MVPRSQAGRVRVLIAQFRIGFLLLLMAASAVFFTTHGTLDTLATEITVLQDTASLRVSTVDVALQARSIHLSIQGGPSVTATTPDTVHSVANNFFVEYDHTVFAAGSISGLQEHLTQPTVTNVRSYVLLFWHPYSLVSLSPCLLVSLSPCLLVA